MVVASARAFGGTLAEAGFPLSTDGTDRPVVVDLRGTGIDGAGAAAFLAAPAARRFRRTPLGHPPRHGIGC